jgi:hypothetical protein
MKSVRGRWREHVGALTIIVLFFVMLFVPVILSGKFFVLYDASSYSHPLRTIALNTIAHGELPLWTPLIMSGYPLLSMSHIGLAYPLTWGYLFLQGHWAEQIYVLAPYLLAPSFMYCYAREMKRSRVASLLAGLAFGYGGLFVIAYVHNGMLANSLMWLPLVLICLERSRRSGFLPSLLLTTGAYAMSVLTGVGQGFLFVGILALAYALFLSLAMPLDESQSEGEQREEEQREDEKRAPSLLSWARWQPLLTMIVAIMLATGVAAFQIMETARAARRSIRSTLEYGVFSGNSFNFSMLLKSLVAPLAPTVFPFDTSAYVAPIVLLLAVYAVVQALRKRRRDVRIFFWCGAAITGGLLMLGQFLPFYWLLHYLPLINLFRAPARHAFEWTFAISILSAYGWDNLSRHFASRADRKAPPARQWQYVLTGLLALSLIIAALWWRQAGSFSETFHESTHLFWKSAFTILLVVIIRQGWKMASSRTSAAILVGALMLGCFIEPCIVITKWWWPITKTSDRFTNASRLTRYLQDFPPEQNRVYTRVGPFEMEYEGRPALDPPNITALYALQNVAGYEPLIMERYSRALGNVGFDATGPRWGYAPDRTLFTDRSHVLDLLNNRFVAFYARSFSPGQYLEKDGIRFSVADEALALKPGTRKTLMAVEAAGDTLALVTTLANAGQAVNGERVAQLRVFTTDGRIIERELRAGNDTAEWAHERANVRDAIRHSLAPIFDSAPGDANNSFPSHRYWSRTPLGERLRIDRVEIINTTLDMELLVSKASVYDSANSISLPLERFVDVDDDFDVNRWRSVYHQEGVRLFRNERCLPRLWLVGEAEAVDGEEALRRIQGKGAQSFDPRRVALLEVAPNELPRLSPNADLTGSVAKLVSYSSNRIVMETAADAPAVLVVSEMNYPGWVATVDGAHTPIYSTDFLLRGIALTAGAHRIEMHYAAPAARIGTFISIFTLAVIASLAVYARRNQIR